MPHFEIAIIDSNILACLSLQQILTDMIPMAEVKIFQTFDAFCADDSHFVHHFVASRIFFEHADFFRSSRVRSIVLVNGDLQIQGVKTLNVCQSEQELLKSMLSLHQHNGNGAHQMPHPPHQSTNKPLLSSREIEVAILLAKGMINKEIADRLSISVLTVITHRKNIMEKLHARSLVDIITYLMMNGLIDMGEL